MQDLIGPGFWTFLELVASKTASEPSTSQASSTHTDSLNFLEIYLFTWSQSPSYIFIKERVLSLTIVSNIAEQGLALLVTEFQNSNAPKKNRKQFLLKIVKEMRAKPAQNATGSEKVTTYLLNKSQYEWS